MSPARSAEATTSGASEGRTRTVSPTAPGTPEGSRGAPAGPSPATTESPHPWKCSAILATMSRPVAARASRSASMVASVPDEVKRTRSTEGTAAAIRSAHSTSRRLPAPK